MKAERLVVLASGSTIVGAVVQQRVTVPFVSSNKWYEVGLGVAIAALGMFVVKKDGISDVMVASGMGYAASAALS